MPAHPANSRQHITVDSFFMLRPQFRVILPGCARDVTAR